MTAPITAIKVKLYNAILGIGLQTWMENSVRHTKKNQKDNAVLLAAPAAPKSGIKK